jgi:hypothetical protein
VHASAGHTPASPLPFSAVGTPEQQPPLQVPPPLLREQPSAPGAKEGLGEESAGGRAPPPPLLSAVSTKPTQEPLPREQPSASGSNEGPHGEPFHVLCQKFASMGKNSKVREGREMWDFS